jgi:hypothetical protein
MCTSRVLVTAAIAAAWGQQAPVGQPSSQRLSPEERAVAYLARETPRWYQENRCYSCHNNGDGVRALYAAAARGYRVPPAALTDTTAWLKRPGNWDHNRGDPAFSDKKLARIQFAASLAAAFEAGLVRDRRVVVEAAQSLLRYQESDGSWQVDAAADLGSPVTYGSFVASWLVREVLTLAANKSDASGLREAVVRLDRWFLNSKTTAVPDLAAVALALRGSNEPAAREKRLQAVKQILRSQSSDGGWGPYAGAPAEPFDTALALLALSAANGAGAPAETAAKIAQGRAYLIAKQLSSGGWPETTRPPGGRSYAQHISTSGWATLALIKTSAKR